jgi:NADH-quinone oxidoreductase subunit M
LGAVLQNLLTIVILLPMLGALMVLVVPDGRVARGVALWTSIAAFLTSLLLLRGFDAAAPFQWEVSVPWVESLGIHYHVGVDGVSLLLVLLTTFLMPLVILSTNRTITTRIKEFSLALMVLETAMLGTFAALDMVLFYVFWELMLIPMFLIIGIWGSENRVYAAVKFFLYTMLGSMPMLVAILYMYWQTGDAGTRTFDYPAYLALNLAPQVQFWLFLAFGLAFAVKVPMFPLHTWLPDAHVQAPAPGSVILAGVLLKMGTYGFYRFAFPLFPAAVFELRTWVVALSVVGIVYGSLMCMAQRDMKKLIAYSSVAHLGFVMLGLVAFTSAGATGAVYQMLNHGVSTGALFLLVGMMYERRHTRLLADYGGIAKIVPVFGTVWLIVTLSSIGLPGTNGFVGEFLILSGTFVSAIPGGKWWAAAAATGVILGAVYMLGMYQRVWQGEVRRDENRAIPDLTLREWVVLAPLIALIFVMGLMPQPFLDLARPGVDRMVARLDQVQPDLAGDVSPALAAATGLGAPGLAPAPRALGRPPFLFPPGGGAAQLRPDDRPMLPPSMRLQRPPQLPSPTSPPPPAR